MRSEKSLIAVVLIGCASAALAAWIYGPGSLREPRLQVPPIVDIGEHEYGTMAVASFEIGNAGKSTLEVKSDSRSCSCSGLEQVVGPGRLIRVERLEVAPGDKTQVVVRFAVTSPPGAVHNIPILLVTNDPRSPERTVVLRVSRVHGGLIFVPSELALGTVDIGTTIQKEVDVYEPAVAQRAIRAPVASNDAYDVTFHPVTVSGDSTANPREPRLIGKLRVTFKTDKPRSLNGQISLPLEEPVLAPISLRILGTVAAPFEASPSALALPLRSSRGDIWAATLDVRSRAGSPFSLTVLECPKGYSCSPPVATAKGQTMEVRLDPAHVNFQKNQPRHLRLLAKSGTLEWPLTVELLPPTTGR